LLVGLAQSGGFALLIIPGVVVSVWFYPVFLVYAKEKLTPVNSLVQCREYARGSFMLIFLRLLLVFLISAVLMLPLAALLMVPFAGRLLAMLGGFFVSAVFFSYLNELYCDLSSRPGVTRADALPPGKKAGVMALPLACAAVGLALGGLGVSRQISDFRASPVQDMMAMASGEMNPEEMQAQMEKMMAEQLQQAAAQGEDMPPGMKEMAEQMAAGLKAAQKPAPAPAAAKPPPAAPVTAAAPAVKAEPTEDEAKEFNDQLAECLADPDWIVRRDAVAAIGHLRLKDFLPQLNRMSRDRDPRVRSEASKAILMVRYGK